jgi:DUF4097 and DUF4098 domain-containing protein YvlB
VPAKVSVQARTSTGDVRVEHLQGDLRLSTSTGDIHVANARANLWAHTGSGDVEATELTSPDIDAATGTGDIGLGLVGPPRRVRADTGTGDVSITVPASGSYRVDADAGTGDVNVGVVTDPNSDEQIVVRTGTGDINVRPA